MMTDRTSHAIASCYVTMYVQELVLATNQMKDITHILCGRHVLYGLQSALAEETSAYHTINTLSL